MNLNQIGGIRIIEKNIIAKPLKIELVNLVEFNGTPQEQIEEFFLNEAIKEAQIGLAQGGIPIGAVIVYEIKENIYKVLGRGHNMRVQQGDPLLHGEMAAYKDAGRQPAEVYEKSDLYTTLSPCLMCTGTTIFYKIKRVIIGENKNFHGLVKLPSNAEITSEDLLIANGIDVKVMNNSELIEMMKKFIKTNPEIWNEDIAVYF